MVQSLKFANAKKEHIFSQIQSKFEMTRKTADPNILQLLVRAKSIHRPQQEFSVILDTCHKLELKVDPDYRNSRLTIRLPPPPHK